MNLLDSWIKAKEVISCTIGEAASEAWINRLEATVDPPNILVLGAPDEFSKDWVNKHYRALIEDALKKLTPQDIHIEFAVLKAHPQSKPIINIPAPQKAASGEKNITSLTLNPRYTFDNFVVGPSNRFSHAASTAVSQSPAKTYNPLFIYGGVGLGKTHLMQAVCHEILKREGEHLKICYTTSEKFTNELIDAIQHHSTSRFRGKYRTIDVLVIDDIQFIAGKEATQEEFFHTFNALYDAHKQIIISSDRTPRDISNLEERLVSRFSWGLVTDVQPPDFETRIAILKKKIENEPAGIPDEVIVFIAQTIKTNIRELEGALIRVFAYSLLENKPISLELTKEVLKDLLKENNKTITVDLIQRQVGEFYHLTPQDLKGAKRDRTIVLARQTAMYLCRELTNFSFPEIGGFFGGKDHTTVLHAYNKIKGCVTTDTKIRFDLEKITQAIKQ